MFKKTIDILLGSLVFFHQDTLVNASIIISSSGKEYVIDDSLFDNPLSEKSNTIQFPVILPTYGNYNRNKEELVIGEDFVHVENALSYPYSIVAYIESIFDGPKDKEVVGGSAFFIKSNVLVTAAHNVFRWDLGGISAKEVYVYPAMNNNDSPFDNKWYYLNTSGEMVTGIQIIQGKTYQFNLLGEWIK